jgi:RNA polymerase-binding transcription factor DksA
MSRVNSIASSIAAPELEAFASRITASIERGEQQLRELESNLIGALRDHDTIQEDQDAMRALVESIRFDVRQARRALDRIAEGTYGKCRECGGPIAIDRLDAMPTAERCARCA